MVSDLVNSYKILDMARGKKPLLQEVKIEKIAAEGKSIAYIDEKVLFVPNTIPGDIVDVQVISVDVPKKRIALTMKIEQKK